MDNLKRQKLSELEVSAEVVRLTMQLTDKKWPTIYTSIREMFKAKFIIENETLAPFDFALALISLGLQSTKNLFTAEQAQRLSEYVYFLVDADEYGKYAKQELEQYQKAFEKFEKTKNYPHDEVASRLLHRLLGKNIHNITLQNTNVLNPFIVMTFSSLLIKCLVPNPWKIIHDQYELTETNINMEELKNDAQKLKQQTMNESKLNSNIDPRHITDLLDKLDIYLEEMRNKEDKVEIPKKLSGYIWCYFRDTNPNKEELKAIALFLADHTYRYAAKAKIVDDYTRIYFASVITELWTAIQAKGVDMFYVLDNELREDKFLLTIQLFALSGVAVVTPYMVKGSYHKYMTPEEQAEWVLSFNNDDFDPKKFSITIDNEYLRYVEVMDLLEKYMKHLRNIIYIEKDTTVNYLQDIKKLAINSKYMSVFRNKAPDDPYITVLSDLDKDIVKQMGYKNDD